MESTNQFRNLLKYLLLNDTEYFYIQRKNILHNTKITIKIKNSKRKNKKI